MEENKEYYIYALIDPHNGKPFYFGKGKDDRKDTHTREGREAEKKEKESEKDERIKAIRSTGKEPLTRILARKFTDEQALLIESTAIWVGKEWFDKDRLTNKVSGHHSKNFRKHDTSNELTHFDYHNKIYHYYVKEKEGNRKYDEDYTDLWEDYKNFGFISVGNKAKQKESFAQLTEDDVIVACLSSGYVGVGTILNTYEREPISLPAGLYDVGLDPNDLKCKHLKKDKRYIASVRWEKAYRRGQEKIYKNSKTYNAKGISHIEDLETIEFINEAFGIDLYSLLSKVEV